MRPAFKAKLFLEISSWVTFAVALAFYWVTADPKVSYWDCPEYVTVASLLEVGHPPGNPVWMLAMRVATIPFPAYLHAYVINLWSGLFMAFAAFFLCRLIFLPVAYFILKQPNLRRYPVEGAIIISAISVGASLCFALCDSAWFSAVEAEVYAMSTFLSALSLWLMMEWWREKQKGRQTRLLILTAYITGLSLGVHQLNLLLLPVFALIICYKKNPGRSPKLLPLTYIICGGALIGVILLGYLPGLLFGAGKMELLSVNNLGLPYNTGVLIFCFLITAVFILGGCLNFRGKLYSATTAIWMLSFLTLGFSSFGIIMIRAKAAPALNEGVPDNIFSLASYISRDQYPSTPLVYGATPYSRPVFIEQFVDGQPVYDRYALIKEKPIYTPYEAGARLNHRSRMVTSRDSAQNLYVSERGRGYLLSDYSFRQDLTPELDMWFPRITSRNTADRQAYADWAGMTEENMVRVPVSEAIDSLGNYVSKVDAVGERSQAFSYRPTYWQNFRFFMSYQAYYMYFRYLFWNFIGRQNDFSSMGEIEHGNFITGFPAIDGTWLGDTSSIPDEIFADNKGRNRYFGIPFIIGIIGILALLGYNRLSRRLLSVTALLWFMTGLAIVVYLNQTPGEPRDRDYTFLVSYMAFAMWIAAGTASLVLMAAKRNFRKLSLAVALVFSAGIPTLMALENFDDHDRRGRFETEFFASSLLDFEQPAIIFSHGDNSSFPLWYASEVLGMGQEHTPIDITYLSLPSYVTNLKKQGNKGITTILPSEEMKYGAFVFSKIPADSVSGPLPLAAALSGLYDSSATVPTFPASKVIIPVADGDSVIVNLRDFTGGSSYLSFRHLMLLDILANQFSSPNPRILYFPSLIAEGFYKPLNPALRSTLFGKIYAPWVTDSLADRITSEAIDQELGKMAALKIQPRYIDPVIQDRIVRYRGELIIAALDQMGKGNTAVAEKITGEIFSKFPYVAMEGEKRAYLLPGNFTMADSTFYEQRAMLSLLDTLHASTGKIRYKIEAEKLDSLVNQRQRVWSRYYQSLSPEQRKALSPRSRRLINK